MYIVELEKNCWIANWDGDPARTIVKDNAQHFETRKLAKKALSKARDYRPFMWAKIKKL